MRVDEGCLRQSTVTWLALLNADSRHQQFAKVCQPSAVTTQEVLMNWDRVEGNWKQLTGKLKEQWGKQEIDDWLKDMDEE
jgi:hypothetical protein